MSTASAYSSFIDALWEKDVLPALCDYIRIPNLSHMFDPKWRENGFTDKAVTLFSDWAKAHLAHVPGVKVDVVRAEGRTPLIFIEIPGTGAGNVFCYGHLDKQPGVTGWAAGKGPWTPVIENDRLYGRGGADDGYAMFAELSAILALANSGKPHPRATVFIESGEESGSIDLPFYMEMLADRIGIPDLIVALDSGCSSYDQMWLTSSLRGIAAGTLKIEVMSEGVHSGDCSGIVPSSFRILRQLLSRLEDEATGTIRLPECFVEVPAERLEQARECARIVGDGVFARMPFVGETEPMGTDPLELVLNRTWRPQLAVIAIGGYPEPESAGNVLLPQTTAKLSIRLPPTCNPQKASAAIANALRTDPPYRAKITYKEEAAQSGWNAPSLSGWLETSLGEAADSTFGKPVAYMGEGGSIPFMAMLGEKYPKAQFIVSGVLGPNANAHGPNEFLHIPMAKKLSTVLAHVLGALAAQ